MSYIKVNKHTCTGCRYCEVVCSFNKHKECEPSRSRIKIDKDEIQGTEKPVVCLQCSKPKCVAACIRGALYKDEKTGIILYIDDLCNQCQDCVKACPFKAIWFHENLNSIIKCDTCGGNPACVKYCPTKTLTLADKGGM
ncbi:MAG: 4Fe-4S dicluster domain-containing protein [Bacillota bacterium]